MHLTVIHVRYALASFACRICTLEMYMRDIHLKVVHVGCFLECCTSPVRQALKSCTCGLCTWNEPAHEIMTLFVLRNLILQTRMRSHPIGLDVWFLFGPCVYFHTLCVRTAKALARLRRCAGSPEPSLVAYVISTIISWAGSNSLFYLRNMHLKVEHELRDKHLKVLHVGYPS